MLFKQRVSFLLMLVLCAGGCTRNGDRLKHEIESQELADIRSTTGEVAPFAIFKLRDTAVGKRYAVFDEPRSDGILWFKIIEKSAWSGPIEVLRSHTEWDVTISPPAERPAKKMTWLGQGTTDDSQTHLLLFAADGRGFIVEFRESNGMIDLTSYVSRFSWEGTAP